MKRTNFLSLAIGIGLGVLVFLVAYSSVTALLDGLTGYDFLDGALKLLAGAAVGFIGVAFLVAPGFEGLPTMSQSILAIVNMRVTGFTFSEGPAWRIPYLSKFITESTKVVTLDFPGLVCMSLDNQEIAIDGAVQLHITDINHSLQVEDFAKTFKQAYESAVRIAAHGREAETLPSSKNWVAETVRNGGPFTQSDGTTIELPGLESFVEGYGRKIDSLNITEIRLSEKYATALEEKRLEAVQAEAEDKDTDTLVRNFSKAHATMHQAGVSGSEVLAAIQARRGYSKNINVSGGSPLERSAAILGDALQGQASAPTNQNGPRTSAPADAGRSQRRRK